MLKNIYIFFLGECLIVINNAWLNNLLPSFVSGSTSTVKCRGMFCFAKLFPNFSVPSLTSSFVPVAVPGFQDLSYFLVPGFCWSVASLFSTPSCFPSALTWLLTFILARWPYQPSYHSSISVVTRVTPSFSQRTHIPGCHFGFSSFC